MAEAIARQEKIDRLANMDAPFAFRLAAIIAADNRPGKFWA